VSSNHSAPTLPSGSNAIETVRELMQRSEELSSEEHQLLRKLAYQKGGGDHKKTAAAFGLDRYKFYRFLNRQGWKPVRSRSIG